MFLLFYFQFVSYLCAVNLVSSMETLYKLCLSAVVKSLRCNIDFDSLPVTVENDLLEGFLECSEDIDSVSEGYVHAVVDVNYWESLNPITKNSFACLMNMRTVPTFAPESCHIVFDYYIRQSMQMNDRSFNLENVRTTVIGLNINLCIDCYLQDSQVCSATSENDWYHKGIYYERWIQHTNIDADRFVFGILKKKQHWCEICLIKPLFSVFDYNMCKSEYNFHSRKRYYNSDSETEDEELDFVAIKRCLGNYMPPAEYDAIYKRKRY